MSIDALHRRQTAFRGSSACNSTNGSASLKTYTFYSPQKKETVIYTVSPSAETLDTAFIVLRLDITEALTQYLMGIANDDKRIRVHRLYHRFQTGNFTLPDDDHQNRPVFTRIASLCGQLG